jgi:hypothetical protein
MAALADDKCRSILMATADEPMTVSELCSECDLPTATAYRKVDHLSELALLEEGIRVKPRGRNSREYRLRADTFHVMIQGQRSGSVTLDCTITMGAQTREQSSLISADGGRVLDESGTGDQQRRLREIFEDVTGTVEFVETETQSITSRFADSDRDVAISEYVAAAARADGLSDAIATPELNDQSD